MKGIQGLIIALALGLIAAGVNWKYLVDQSKQGKTNTFVVVRADKAVKQGQVFRSEDLALIHLPEMHSKTLAKMAYDNVGAVVGFKANKDYEGNEFIFSQQMKTPSAGTLPLKENEVAVYVPVDNRRFISEHVIPGQTQVMFRLPKTGPTPAGGGPDSNLELVGPFEVLSVGNRRGEIETMRGESIRSMQEHVLAIRGKLVGGKQLDALTNRVASYLDKSNNRPLDVVVCPEREVKK